MSVGAAIYGYRNNFQQATPNRIPKKRKITLKLFDLIRDGYMRYNKYEVDLFVGICQWLMKKGYPCGLRISDNISNIQQFYMDALFSLDIFRFQYLYVNKQQFDLLKWREQFDLFNDTEIKLLNYYRNRASMPIKAYSSFNDITKVLFTNKDKYGKDFIKLPFSFNSSWKKAVWILGKDCYVQKDYFAYTITYGCHDDYKNKLNKKSHSSWSISIRSEINENYIDFCLRIYENYEKIIAGDKDVLISESEGDNFYLGGNFKLKNIDVIN